MTIINNFRNFCLQLFFFFGFSDATQYKVLSIKHPKILNRTGKTKGLENARNSEKVEIWKLIEKEFEKTTKILKNSGNGTQKMENCHKEVRKASEGHEIAQPSSDEGTIKTPGGKFSQSPEARVG